jgi:hypothetical protein
MRLITKDIRSRLIANGELHRQMRQAGKAEPDFLPVVKLFTPDANATWLLAEIDPDDHDRAFGLCDLGLGFPELGYVSLTELETLRGKSGLPVERDLYFRPRKTLSEYAHEARERRRITA